MVRPHDEDAFNLATDIMKHRLAFLTKERMSGMKDRFEALNALEIEKKALQERFENIKRYWKSWAWPVNSGREIVDKRTPVPSIDGKYEPPKFSSYLLSNRVIDKYQKEHEDDAANVVGEAAYPIWTAFVQSREDTSGGGEQSKFDPRDWVRGNGRVRNAAHNGWFLSAQVAKRFPRKNGILRTHFLGARVVQLRLWIHAQAKADPCDLRQSHLRAGLQGDGGGISRRGARGVRCAIEGVV